MAEEIIKSDVDMEEVDPDQYLVFMAKSQEFGIQALRVQEISRVLETTAVPNAPVYIEGIMNLRGKLASVINFRKKFGIELKAYDEDTRTIIVEHKGFPIGILVDSVEEVIKIPDEKVQQLPESARSDKYAEYIKGVGLLDKRLITLLDIEKILESTQLLSAESMNQIVAKGISAPAVEPQVKVSEDKPPLGEEEKQVTEEKKGRKKKTAK